MSDSHRIGPLAVGTTRQAFATRGLFSKPDLDAGERFGGDTKFQPNQPFLGALDGVHGLYPCPKAPAA